MHLIVNGESQELENGRSIPELLAHLGIEPERVAIELDRRIVKRELWAATELHDGAKLEIVQFVGGG